MFKKTFNLTLFGKYLTAILLSGLMVCAVQAAPLRVTILSAEEGAPYQEFSRAFIGEAQRQNISLNILQSSSLPADTDLIVAVGIKSALIASKSHFAVLCVLVSRTGFEKILSELPANRETDTFSAIYLDQPIKRQIAMVVAALPAAKNIGLLVSAHSPDASNLRNAAYDNKLEFHVQKLESAGALYRDLEIVLQESDVLLAVPDAEIYNSLTMRNILLATYRSGVPVVGFLPAYVRAGALCAVFSTPAQIATQAAELTRQFIETDRLPGAQYPVEFDVMVNRQVAISLGIQIRDNAELNKQLKAKNANEGTD